MACGMPGRSPRRDRSAQPHAEKQARRRVPTGQSHADSDDVRQHLNPSVLGCAMPVPLDGTSLVGINVNGFEHFKFRAEEIVDALHLISGRGQHVGNLVLGRPPRPCTARRGR